MKTVVLYETGSAPMEKIMATFPRHNVLVDAFAGGREGSMGIFRDRAAAESFVAQDPFVLEGLVAKVRILDWSDELLK